MNRAEVLERFGQIASRKLALSSERSYRAWISQFLDYLVTTEAKSAGTSEKKLELFLSGMARQDYSKVSQDQAFNAILFLYRHVLRQPLGDVSALRCRRRSRERYIPTQAEILAILHQLRNTEAYNIRLLASLLYGCGLRVSEACQLRIKDIDLDRRHLTVFEGKGDKDRQVTLPAILLPAVSRQLARARALADIDVAAAQPVQLPGRLDRKYPRAQFDPRWHFLFPSPHCCRHPRTGKIVRWCIGPEIIQRAVRQAAVRAGIPGKVTPHCFRHSFCSDLLDSGSNPRRVQEAMGHSDIRTTMGYARKECLDLASPLDRAAPAVVQFPGTPLPLAGNGLAAPLRRSC